MKSEGFSTRRERARRDREEERGRIRRGNALVSEHPRAKSNAWASLRFSAKIAGCVFLRNFSAYNLALPPLHYPSRSRKRSRNAVSSCQSEAPQCRLITLQGSFRSAGASGKQRIRNSAHRHFVSPEIHRSFLRIAFKFPDWITRYTWRNHDSTGKAT